MLEALTAFNTRTNRMFGTCVEIQNMAARLTQTTVEMRLLAANGVVYAAHLPGGEGRPLLALANILTGIPDQIRPTVRLLEQLCGDLARCTGECSNRVRLYYQMVRSLLSSREEGLVAADGFDADTARLTRPSEVQALYRLLQQSGDARAAHLGVVADRCLRNLGRIGEELDAADKVLLSVERKLGELRNIGLTARYLAQYVEVEAARLDDGRDSFGNLAGGIHQALDHMDEVQTRLVPALRTGNELVSRLQAEIDHR